MVANEDVAAPRRGMAPWKLVTLIVAGVLVVMALACGGLIALLLPALSQARDSARQAQQVSNARQVAIVVAVYTIDHDGLLPHDPALLTAYAPGPELWTSAFRDAPLPPAPRGARGPASRYGDVVLLWPAEKQRDVAEPNKTLGGWMAKLDPARPGRVAWFVDGHCEVLDEARFRALVPAGVDVDALDGP